MPDTVPNRPEIDGIHHLKFAVSNLDDSLAFYQRLFGARRIPEADHHKQADGSLYAYILDVPGLGAKLELRLNAEQAQKHRRFDPVTIAVKDQDALAQWGAFLDAEAISHSPMIPAIQSWVVVVDDPDQNRMRLYSLASHGPEIKPDEDNVWLQD